MKIKEISITRYGPLPPTRQAPLNNFNLFFGKNEDGKTLTIDALVKLLLGQNIRDFEHIDRVDENPEGYVIIEDEKGNEIKLPEKGNLTKISGLTPSECCNIFIIRNSNLSIARESDFYTNITDRLTGLRTADISKIKDSLREIGRITPSGIFRDIKTEKLKTRIDKAKSLVKTISNLSEEIKKEGYDKLEEESAKHREEIGAIKQKIESLEDARKRERYEKGKVALDKLKDALKKLKNLDIYDENDERSWRDSERDIKFYDDEKVKLLDELNVKEIDFKEIRGELRKKEQDFQVIEERKRKLDDIKPEVQNYEIKSGELASKEGKSQFFTYIGISSVILFGISLFGIIFRPSLLFYILAVLFSILTIISGILKFQFVRDKAWLAGVFERNKLKLSKLELFAENIEETLLNIQKFDEEYSRTVGELGKIETDGQILDGKIQELKNNRIPDMEKKIKFAREEIDSIKRKSKEESLQEYTKKLKLKQKHKDVIGEQKSFLNSLFEEKSELIEENISYWDKELADLEKYRDKAKETKYNEKTASELIEREELFEKNLKEITNKMESLHTKMEGLERNSNEILRLGEEYLHCKTSVDLEAIEDKLRLFINESENVKDNALVVLKIFEDIEAEEKEKVSELFVKDSSISKYFNELTHGLYEEVMFDQTKGEIEVKRRDGKLLGAEKLSGCAYDQLYLSIRLALGEKLLKGIKGFFIMDDPFIKADPDRLQKQIETLKKISKSGWQIMYFSAKGEVWDALKEDIKKGDINTVEMQSIFF